MGVPGINEGTDVTGTDRREAAATISVRVDDELTERIAGTIDEHAYNGADWDHGEPPDHPRCEYCVCGWFSTEQSHAVHVAAAVVAALQEGAEK